MRASGGRDGRDSPLGLPAHRPNTDFGKDAASAVSCSGATCLGETSGDHGGWPVSRAVRSSRWVVTVAISGTAFIACLAFWLSFTALTQLAVRAGIDARQAWAWPLIVDGCIIVATVAVVALRGRAGSRYAWALLVSGAFVSVTANAIQAAWPPEEAIARWLAAAICSVPPIVLLAITHLTVILARKDSASSKSEIPVRPGPPAVAAPERTPQPVLEIPVSRSATSRPSQRHQPPPTAGWPVPALRNPGVSPSVHTPSNQQPAARVSSPSTVVPLLGGPTTAPLHHLAAAREATADKSGLVTGGETARKAAGASATDDGEVVSRDDGDNLGDVRPDAFDPRITQALELRERGLTNKQIATQLGVSETTIRRWRKVAAQ